MGNRRGRNAAAAIMTPRLLTGEKR